MVVNVTDWNRTSKCETNWGKAELPFLLILSMVIGVVSVFVLSRIRTANNRVHHFLVNSLAVNDLVSTILIASMWIGNVAVCGKFGGDLVCSLQGWLATVMVIWSAWIVVVMSAVRYLSVAKPFYYKLHVNMTKVKLALLITLVITCIFFIFPFTGLVEPYKLFSVNYICAYNYAPGDGDIMHRVFLGLLSALGLSTIAVVLYLNGMIVYVLRLRRFVAPSEYDVFSRIRERRNSYANMQTKLVACVYCICYGPFLTRLMYDVILNVEEIKSIRHSVTLTLLFISPLLNPLVYTACNKNFRQYIMATATSLLTKLGIRNRDERPAASRSGNTATGNQIATIVPL